MSAELSEQAGAGGRPVAALRRRNVPAVVISGTGYVGSVASSHVTPDCNVVLRA